MSIHKRKQSGFTLLEIIISLVLLGIMGTFAFTFLRGTVVPNTQFMLIAEQLAEARSVLEDISAEYRQYLGNIIDWNTFTTYVNDADGGPNTAVSSLSGNENGTEYLDVTVSTGDQEIGTRYYKVR